MLTKEQIEEWRRSFGGGSIDFHALCDLALRGIEDRRDAERLDWLEDIGRCYWVTVQTRPHGGYLFSGQGPALRSAIDRAMAEGREGK